LGVKNRTVVEGPHAQAKLVSVCLDNKGKTRSFMRTEKSIEVILNEGSLALSKLVGAGKL
jgi:hypothetical protein